MNQMAVCRPHNLTSLQSFDTNSFHRRSHKLCPYRASGCRDRKAEIWLVFMNQTAYGFGCVDCATYKMLLLGASFEDDVTLLSIAPQI